MNIRQAEAADYPGVAHVFQDFMGESFELDPELYRTACDDPGYLVFVAEQDDAIVGVAVTVVTSRIRLAANSRRQRYHQDQLIVLPEHRRQGIAKALLQRVIETARQNAPSYIIVNCDFTNVAARRTYESVGFNLVRQSGDRFEAAFT